MPGRVVTMGAAALETREPRPSQVHGLLSENWLQVAEGHHSTGSPATRGEGPWTLFTQAVTSATPRAVGRKGGRSGSAGMAEGRVQNFPEDTKAPGREGKSTGRLGTLLSLPLVSPPCPTSQPTFELCILFLWEEPFTVSRGPPTSASGGILLRGGQDTAGLS